MDNPCKTLLASSFWTHQMAEIKRKSIFKEDGSGGTYFHNPPGNKQVLISRWGGNKHCYRSIEFAYLKNFNIYTIQCFRYNAVNFETQLDEYLPSLGQSSCTRIQTH